MTWARSSLIGTGGEPGSLSAALVKCNSSPRRQNNEGVALPLILS